MDKKNVMDGNSTAFISASTSQTKNVRTKVRSWMTDIANEMKRKSPAAVQKWVDSIPSTSSSGTVANISTVNTESETNNDSETTVINNKTIIEEQPEEESYNHDNYMVINTPNTTKTIKRLFKDFSLDDDNEDADTEPDNDTDYDINKHNNDTSSRFIKFWNKNKNDVNKITDNLTTLSKNKVNEIYDKINKKKFHLNLNTKTKDFSVNTENSFIDNVSDNLLEIPKTNNCKELVPAAAVSPGTSVIETSPQTESNTNGKLNYTEFVDNLLINKNNIKCNQRKIGIGTIGRSISENPNRINKKRQYLGNIGRSFSETNDNDDDDDELNKTVQQSLINTPTTSTSQFFNNNHKYNAISREHSLSDNSSRQRNHLLRDSSIQSDSSHCSSVESLLEARKPDPEAILINLGFGPEQSEDILSKIPRRFLKPSQVRGIDTEAFLRQQQLALNLHENSVLGYRGLVGNPHIPPSTIVAKIMERFHINNERSRYLNDNDRPLSAPPIPPGPERDLN